MHEAALAHSILKTILEVATKNKAREVLRVEMEIGEICLVNMEQLAFHIGLFARETIAKDMEFLVKKVETKIRCKECSYFGGIEYKEIDPEWHYRVPIFGCVRCRSNMTEIVQGKDLMIRSIDVS
ncbi:MAG: hydrogenase maturation nickel metallochaperone HypA [Thermodesulfobacteriota bacterium]|jgi:hydrogenase nickel insertion protein HypA